jgi:hypothetical protein
MRVAVPRLPLYAFMAWFSVKNSRGAIDLYLTFTMEVKWADALILSSLGARFEPNSTNGVKACNYGLY